MQCALGWIPTGTLVIAWRGTANFKNVLTDIKFFSRKVGLSSSETDCLEDPLVQAVHSACTQWLGDCRA